MAAIEISDLVFPAFNKKELESIPLSYGIEIFYEFGGNAYWDSILQRLQIASRPFSIHGPCVTVNLADPADTAYLRRYEETFAYGKKTGATFVVVHTNERWQGDAQAFRKLVVQRLHEIDELACRIGGPAMVIENVGLGRYTLFDEAAYTALFEEFPDAAALIDVGHGHVNGWDLCRVVEKLNGRIAAFHLHDNDGCGDQHLPIQAGTIDWPALFAAIRQYASKAVQVLEYANGDFSCARDLLHHMETIQAMLP